MEMPFEKMRVIRGVRYGRDNLGWIWREVREAKPGQPRWLRTGFSTFDQIEALR